MDPTPHVHPSKAPLNPSVCADIHPPPPASLPANTLFDSSCSTFRQVEKPRLAAGHEDRKGRVQNVATPLSGNYRRATATVAESCTRSTTRQRRTQPKAAANAVEEHVLRRTSSSGIAIRAMQAHLRAIAYRVYSSSTRSTDRVQCAPQRDERSSPTSPNNGLATLGRRGRSPSESSMDGGRSPGDTGQADRSTVQAVWGGARFRSMRIAD